MFQLLGGPAVSADRSPYPGLRMLSRELQADLLMHHSERLEIEQIIARRQIEPVFQPIISLRDGIVHGYESLSRLTHTGTITKPEVLFDQARKHGLTVRIETLCRDKALTHASQIGLAGMIFLNVCPGLLHTEEHRRGYTAHLLAQLGIDQTRVVFELTEKTLINDYALFERGVEHYRSQGYKIAIDDLGEGYAGLKMLAQVIPDYVKLARFLVTEIDKSPIKQALVEAILCFCKKIGVQVIAEGVERSEELQYLAAIGVDFGQGYLLGKPAAAPMINQIFPLPKMPIVRAVCLPEIPCRLSDFNR
ncbi:MAG: EAL domain-containing protein [Desulfuromonadales bacterium]|nr:EAL domain-containing protein [Desulfuromonadales bacterium]